MAKARAIIKRRQAVQNIRKITRTMELIATAKFKKALDRAIEAEAYTRKIAELVADLGETAKTVKHPLLEAPRPRQARASGAHQQSRAGRRLQRQRPPLAFGPTRTSRPRGSRVARRLRQARRQLHAVSQGGDGHDHTQFEDRPQFHEVEKLADRYIALYVKGEIDRLDVVYTQFVSSARQTATVVTLLPIITAEIGQAAPSVRHSKSAGGMPRPPVPGRASAL